MSMSIELLNNIEILTYNNYTSTLNTNGFHKITMYISKTDKKVISYKNFLELKKFFINGESAISEKEFHSKIAEPWSHLGIKCNLFDDMSLIALFTNTRTINFIYDFPIRNIELGNFTKETLNQFMNPPLLVSNSDIANFLTISNDITQTNQYRQSKIKYGEKDALNMLINESYESFKYGLIQNDYNINYILQEYYNIFKIKHPKLILKTFTVESILKASENNKEIMTEIQEISKNITDSTYWEKIKKESLLKIVNSEEWISK